MSPQMHCQSCEQRIKGNIRFVKGTKIIDTSVGELKVTIVYGSKKANYDAYVVAAFHKQHSPQGCNTSWGWLVGRTPKI